MMISSLSFIQPPKIQIMEKFAFAQYKKKKQDKSEHYYHNYKIML